LLVATPPCSLEGLPMESMMMRALIVGLVTVLAGCQSGVATVESALMQTQSGVDKYGLSWVKDGVTSDGSLVVRADTFIAAPPDVVWKLMRDPNHYADFNKALTAQIDTMAIGAPITLYIRLFGDALPATTSDEKVAIFDEAVQVASWDRDFGLGQFTHRPQLIEPEGNGTHYYTALSLPPALGWLVVATLGNNIHDAFARFACGLRDAAEAAAAH
jgi:hypothetical protein